MKKEFHLLVDDLRDNLGPMDLVARNSATALEALRTNAVTHLYLDNDLGLASQEGWEILSIIIKERIFPDFIQLVTSNVVARQRMKSMLLHSGYITSDGINFKLIK